MDEANIAVITEQLGRLADRIDARLKAVEERLIAHQTLEDERTGNIKSSIKDLKDTCEDHEKRIRTTEDKSTKNQVILGLASGGSGLVSIIALLKAWLGGP